MHKMRVAGQVDAGRPYLGLPARAIVSKLSAQDDKYPLDNKSPRNSVDSLNKPAQSKNPVSPRQIPLDIQVRLL
jgi:hypothetical protein